MQDAEALASSSQGADVLWDDGRTVPATLRLLAVPPTGPQHMQCQHPDVQRAFKVRTGSEPHAPHCATC